MAATNHQYKLAARPFGLPKPSDGSYTEEPVPEPGEGEVLVKVLYISLDPAMRGWMNEGRSYIPPVEHRRGHAGARRRRVVASKHPGLARGRHVDGAARRAGVRDRERRRASCKVDTTLAPLAVYSARSACPA